MDAKALHKALLRPDAYPDEAGPIGHRETHISHLYFTDRHVYKVKKAVDFGFLNFTSQDRRRFYCHEEVRLNQRFSPGTYLGVVDIRRQQDRIAIDGAGEVIDYAVKMQRLPEERMLTCLLAEDDPTLPSEMVRLARRLAELHRGSEIVHDCGGRSDLDLVQHNWQENFAQTAPFIGQTIDARGQAAAVAWVERFLAEHAPLLHRRQMEGFVRDGHGDLHAEHVCLTEPVRIFDCIEFNRRFRVADVASDLAFLLMDLDFRGRRDLVALTLAAYRQAAGEDPDLPLLLPFYKIYRAWVRGKVESLLAADVTAEAEARTKAEARARRYFSLALGYLCPPVLALTCGLMGVGKTTFARALASALGAGLLRSDELRKELAGLLPGTGQPEPYATGIYTPEMTRRTYDELLARARPLLTGGHSVVADASFAMRTERQRIARLAAEIDVPSLVLALDCPAEVALDRLDRRQASGGDASDGRRELYAAQAAAFESPNDGEENVIRIDTAADVDYNVQLALCAILESVGMRP